MLKTSNTVSTKTIFSPLHQNIPNKTKSRAPNLTIARNCIKEMYDVTAVNCCIVCVRSQIQIPLGACLYMVP